MERRWYEASLGLQLSMQLAPGQLFQFRVWARPSFINKTDYAVAAGPKVLDYYSSYFGIPFPLPKQGMRGGAKDQAKDERCTPALPAYRHAGHPRLRSGGHGELGSGHLPRDGASL